MEEKFRRKKPYSVKPHKKYTGRYLCVICGYIYDEAEHDVRFEDLPDNYRCPLCLAGKSYFDKL
jgi:rubredoxin